MRIGVICEGPSDYHAIEFFFGHSLKAVGIEAEFKALQPPMDRTQPEGGWSNLLLWLKNNPPETRIPRYFGSGLFGGELAGEPFNCLLVQMDSDILGEEGFSNYISENFRLHLGNPVGSESRAAAILSVIENACQFDQMTDADRERHVSAPSIESTESWCIAAFKVPTADFEVLSGQDLIDEFMTALESSESRQASPPYASIDKSPERRRKFCHKHANGSGRIVQGCSQFSAAHNRLIAISAA